ncbi:Fur family transcriptional regulator [Cohnella nanjingensis]|uniref:Transcriptional repressor n=1 Tax=Cohnella nanjingensis TaxID=1387779 RepID=A0A7X0RXC9_9BACL|nr:Fur family transcriptional regulator [Cohnella nanjingensis]MBB6675290.1 transcriptional repressor [Cohnella nanjingensis]
MSEQGSGHDHAAHAQSPSETIQDMLNAMNQAGWRITDQRRTLARIFAATDGYLSPKDVYDQLSVKYPSVSFNTVYRNLRMLSDMGVLEQFYFMDGGLKFKANCIKHHHHHLICTNCEKTLTFDYCPMKESLDLPGRYRILNHRFEIYGVCEQCQQDPSAKEI